MLQGTLLPYDLPYTLMANLVHAAGGQVREIRVSLLANRVGTATIVIFGRDGVQTVDARMSDAVKLALVPGPPIRLDMATLTENDGPDGFQHRVMTTLYADGTASGAEIATQSATVRPSMDN